jgi:hypothetical protein
MSWERDTHPPAVQARSQAMAAMRRQPGLDGAGLLVPAVSYAGRTRAHRRRRPGQSAVPKHPLKGSWATILPLLAPDRALGCTQNWMI